MLIPILVSAKVGQEIQNFFKILIHKNRISLLSDLKEVIENEISSLNNEVGAKISSPADFNANEKKILLNYLTDTTHKKIKPEFIKTKELLGGFEAKVGHVIFDGSLENSLSILKEKFLSLN